MCALRWNDRERRPGEPSVLRVARALYYDDGKLAEKDTKTHQQRGLVLDPETDTVLDELEARTRQRTEALNVDFNPAGHMFSPVPAGSRPQDLTLVSKRYARLAKRLGIDTSIKNMRHYNATELIYANHRLGIVAARLGHGGGGTTTLRVYTARVSEADQRAAAPITARMPPRPTTGGGKPAKSSTLSSTTDAGLQPYQQIAADH
jgi:hypothetical protein